MVKKNVFLIIFQIVLKMDYEEEDNNNDDDNEETYTIEEYDDENEQIFYEDDDMLINKKEEESDDKLDDVDIDAEETDIVDEEEYKEGTLDTEYINNKNYGNITKFEFCRVLESMCLMIGDPNFIIPPEIPSTVIDILEIAEYWIFNTKLEIPVDIIRPHFNKKSEIINVRKLKIPKNLNPQFFN